MKENEPILDNEKRTESLKYQRFSPLNVFKIYSNLFRIYNAVLYFISNIHDNLIQDSSLNCEKVKRTSYKKRPNQRDHVQR